MSDDADKSGAAVRFPPPVAAVLTIIGGYVLGQLVPVFEEFALTTPARYWIGGGLIAIAIALFGIWPIRLFKATEQNVTPWSETPEIIIQGPYKITRNPMYLMMVLVALGFSILLAEVWILILTPVLAIALYHIAIKHEEAYLEAKFGDSYRRYKQSVRRWL